MLQALQAQLAKLENDLAAGGRDSEAYKALQRLEAELSSLQSKDGDGEAGALDDDVSGAVAREAAAQERMQRLLQLNDDSNSADDVDDPEAAQRKAEMARLLKNMEELAERKKAAAQQLELAHKKRLVAERMGSKVRTYIVFADSCMCPKLSILSNFVLVMIL